MLHYSSLGAAFWAHRVVPAQAVHHSAVKVQDGGEDETGVLHLAFVAFAHLWNTVLWKGMVTFLHHPWDNVCASGLALLTSESPHGGCLHSPSCSLPGSHLGLGASEDIVPCGHHQRPPAPPLHILASDSAAFVSQVHDHEGSRVFPSEGDTGPATMSEGGQWGTEAGRDAPHCMD